MQEETEATEVIATENNDFSSDDVTEEKPKKAWHKKLIKHLGRVSAIAICFFHDRNYIFSIFP